MFLRTQHGTLLTRFAKKKLAPYRKIIVRRLNVIDVKASCHENVWEVDANPVQQKIFDLGASCKESEVKQKKRNIEQRGSERFIVKE